MDADGQEPRHRGRGSYLTGFLLTFSLETRIWSSGEFFQTLLKVLKACLTALLQNLMSVDSQASAGRRGRHSQFGNVT